MARYSKLPALHFIKIAHRLLGQAAEALEKLRGEDRTSTHTALELMQRARAELERVAQHPNSEQPNPIDRWRR